MSWLQREVPASSLVVEIDPGKALTCRTTAPHRPADPTGGLPGQPTPFLRKLRDLRSRR